MIPAQSLTRPDGATSAAPYSIMATVPQGGGIVQPLSAAIGLLLMAIYAAIVLVIGGVLFMTRDA
jgi:hypothetical protein